MKYASPAVAVLAALAAAGAAYPSAGAGGPSEDPFVAGGGRIGPGTFPGGFQLTNPRDFSVDAHLDKKGQKVSGIFLSGQNGVSSTQTNVTCISIEGTELWWAESIASTQHSRGSASWSTTGLRAALSATE
jgi:hypothetical protein